MWNYYIPSRIEHPGAPQGLRSIQYKKRRRLHHRSGNNQLVDLGVS